MQQKPAWESFFRAVAPFGRPQQPIPHVVVGGCPCLGPVLSLAEKKKAARWKAALQFYSLIPYFFLKRSTRPAVSTSFCLPV